ncbi:hypothetical protein PVAND_007209 [Polypedilum vanderplanki]|uniref:Sodium/nucleoside cotransporter n=1 Tax=Polypedilum vanderplanki TaxID=319348 RepID=A0A9J6C6K2_POLVA|nr:hypothetical protein PVAND_007209 [Polypedilum vanderplanki]
MSGVQNNGFRNTEIDENETQFNLYRRPKQSNPENIFLPPVDYDNDDQTQTTLFKEDQKPKQQLWKMIIILVIIHGIIIGYISFATYKFISTRDNCERDCELTLCAPYGMLLLVGGVLYVGLIYFKIIKPYFGKFIYESIFTPIGRFIKNLFKTVISKVILAVVLIAAFIGYIIYETHTDFMRLRALIGISLFVGIGYLISAHRTKIIWRPVVCGAILQFVLGVIFIRWPVGREIFACFGDKVAEFFEYGKEGAAFVYSDFLVYEKGVFAFAILAIIYFFSLCVSILYYVGAMQWILFKLGWVLQSILGTTVCESVNAAGNIFLGQTESPLVIKPYIKKLTHSEIHAVMVSGLSTVSGSVMAAYINFGAEPSHLITASVMAAPASLFFAKLVWPETEESNTSAGNIQLEKSTNTSVLDAASSGASNATDLILNIIANLVAFVAFIAFADGMVKWITYLMGFEDVGVQYILGKIFMPVSWIIGVSWEDSEAVGNVIGTKLIVNEFVGFGVLGGYIERGEISPRSAAIATYAICSFANPASIGIMVGGLSALAPERRPSITKVAIRAFFAACFVTFVTASIAGLLMTDELIHGHYNKLLSTFVK